MLLDRPPSVTNCHTFSDPLERDVLYERPHICVCGCVCVRVELLLHSLQHEKYAFAAEILL